MAVLALAGTVSVARQAGADSTGWKGTSSANWNTGTNWDAGVPGGNSGSIVDLFFGNSYNTAGAAGSTTANNNISAFSGHSLTFDATTGGSSHAFTITGNSFSLFSFSGPTPSPQIINLSDVTQTFNLTSGQTITFNGNSTGFGQILATGGDLNFSSTTPIDLDGTTQLRLNASANKTITLNGGITSTGNNGNNTVLVNGAGTVVLGGAGTFGGGLTLNSDGKVKVTNANAFGTFSVSLTNTSNGTLQFAGSQDFSVLGQQGITINTAVRSAPDLSGNAAIENLSGTNSISGQVRLTGLGNSGGIVSTAGTLTLSGGLSAVGGNQTFYLYGAGDGVVTGLVTDISTNNASVAKMGSGTWSLNNANNNFRGTVEIDRGVLAVTWLADGLINNSSLGASSNAPGNLVIQGGTLRYTGTGSSTDRLFTVGVPGATIESSGTGAVNFTNTGSIVSSASASATYQLSLDSATIQTIAGSGTARNLTVGQTVSGSGISAGTTIAAINYDTGTITLSGPATADGANPLTFGAANRLLTLAGTNTGANTISGKLSDAAGGGTLGIVKNGIGSWVLNGASTYTGATIVNNGKLTVDSAGLTTPRLAGTSNIVLNGGTLLLAGGGSSDRLNNSASVNLAGGKLDLGGFSEGTPGSTGGVGALTLTSTSTLDFGTVGTNNLIEFGGVGTHTPGSILQIVHWEGTNKTFGGPDQLLFAGSASAFTALFGPGEVSFNGSSGYRAIQFSGYYEIYGDTTAIPEPSTWFAGFMVIVLIGWRERRRLRDLF